MALDPPDGTLAEWDDIAGEADWQVLLLGNGLSINVWPPFGYARLLDYAKSSDLSLVGRQLFSGTTNFERVLGDLNTAIRVCDVLGIPTDDLYESYRAIQIALGHAVRKVHLARSDVPDYTLDVIRNAMLEFEWIFTTSYDLLLYWAMGYGGKFAPFLDHFRRDGKCAFDPDRADVYEGKVPLYYLHGALHLVVGGDGVTWKRTQALSTILGQFGRPVSGDPQARPLLVTEGSAVDKLRAIESNDYLTHAIARLEQLELPLVVFGSALGREDDHLVAALSLSPSRPVAISMLPGEQRDLLPRQSDIWRRLEADEVYFFDATTHPLGWDLSAAVT